jgi:hypothetical protein
VALDDRLPTYEQIPIVFNHSYHGSSVYRFLSATGNDRDEFDGIDYGSSLADSPITGTAQEQWRGKTESVED